MYIDDNVYRRYLIYLFIRKEKERTKRKGNPLVTIKYAFANFAVRIELGPFPGGR